MSGDFNTSILNRVAFLLFGKQLGAEAEDPQPVSITEDRELRVAVRNLSTDEAEGIETADGTVLSGVSSIVFTNTTSKKLPVCVELANSLNFDGATALVTYSLDGLLAEKVYIPSITPVPLGAPGRWGPIHLSPGGRILASCSPPFTVTLTPVPGARI